MEVSVYPIHPAAALFPAMPSAELAALADDIRLHGLREPVHLYQGQILDGRHRVLACQQVGVPVRYDTVPNDTEPLAYVVSMNLQRRHLTESQRAMVAATLANMRQGERTDLSSIELRSQPQAAAMLNVSTASLKRAHKVRTEAQPALIAAVEQGIMPVSVAATIADEPREFQRAVVAKLAEGLKPSAAVQEVRRASQKAHLETLAGQEVAHPTGLYDVLVIDPPWPMHKIERDVRPNQVETDYPTMDEAALQALSLPCAEHCHVWLWTTHKYLPMAFRLLDTWGLTYVCCFTWHKPGGYQPFGLPQYNSEFALYARKGSPAFIDTKALFTCFEAPRGRHSEKPDAFYDTLRRVTAGRRLDMFSRRDIEGFDGWGQEAPYHAV